MLFNDFEISFAILIEMNTCNHVNGCRKMTRRLKFEQIKSNSNCKINPLTLPRVPLLKLLIFISCKHIQNILLFFSFPFPAGIARVADQNKK